MWQLDLKTFGHFFRRGKEGKRLNGKKSTTKNVSYKKWTRRRRVLAKHNQYLSMSDLLRYVVMWELSTTAATTTEVNVSCFFASQQKTPPSNTPTLHFFAHIFYLSSWKKTERMRNMLFGLFKTYRLESQQQQQQRNETEHFDFNDCLLKGKKGRRKQIELFSDFGFTLRSIASLYLLLEWQQGFLQ